jgi:hypothetical protein
MYYYPKEFILFSKIICGMQKKTNYEALFYQDSNQKLKNHFITSIHSILHHLMRINFFEISLQFLINHTPKIP